MRRTLITLDRDYFDDARFPPSESGGVIVLSAPDERQLARVLRRVDRQVFRARSVSPQDAPLSGRKVHVHPEIAETVRRRRRSRR
jgi:hypothetical protein